MTLRNSHSTLQAQPERTLCLGLSRPVAPLVRNMPGIRDLKAEYCVGQKAARIRLFTASNTVASHTVILCDVTAFGTVALCVKVVGVVEEKSTFAKDKGENEQ